MFCGVAAGVFVPSIIELLSGRMVDFAADTNAESEYVLMLAMAATVGLLAMLTTRSIKAVQQKNEIRRRGDLVASIESRR